MTNNKLGTRPIIFYLTSFVILTSILAPLLLIGVRSFAIKWFFPNIWPTEIGLKHWAYTFSDGARIIEALLNSSLAAILVTALAILIGLPAARTLGQKQFKAKAIVEWTLLLPILVPPMVSVMGIHVIFIKLQLSGTLFGIALVHLIPALPYFILVMTSVFENLGTELEDTAKTLGAKPHQLFWNVTLPAIMPGLMVACLFTFLISWSQYVTSLLIGGGQFLTLPLILFPYLSGGNASVGAAVTLLFVAPALLILIFTSKSLNQNSSIMGGFGRL